MNKLTEQEFQDRIQAVARARRIFIDSGVAGGNITTAFTLYQEVLAEQERAVLINTLTAGDSRPPALLDAYVRPKCPDCGSDLRFRVVPQNDEGVKTQLVCSNQKCPLVLNSDETLDQWIAKLEKKK
jgi:hypothetical protein